MAPVFFRLVLALKLLLSTYFASLHYYLGLLSPWNPRVSFSGLLHARLDSWNNSPCFQDLSVDMQNILSLLGSQLSYNTGISTLKCSTVWLQARVPPDFRLIPALKLLLSTYFASLRYHLGSLLPWNPRISTSETFYCTCLGFQRHAFPYCPVCLCPEIYLTTHFSWSVIMNAW